MIYFILVLCSLLTSNAENNVLPYFKRDFVFGTTTSAYQTEGAWNHNGKGLSIWDYFTHTNPDAIIDKSNGDIACNSYYLYKRDVQMLKELGVKAYRFSISWTRILPYGHSDYVNQIGIDHYNALIDELIKNDITPFVTMYHWDLPLYLNISGGWLNEDIVDWFGDYARILYQNFGDRVKNWFTVNEPYIHCRYGYGLGIHPPGIRSPEVAFYECGRHMLLANAKAYHIYNNEFRATQRGQVGPVFYLDWPEPASDSPCDADAVSSYLAFVFGQYVDPIFSEHGNYPQLLIDQVAAASVKQGYKTSRLRPFTRYESNYIKGSADFLALNTFRTVKVYRNESLVGMNDTILVNRDGCFGIYMTTFVPLNVKHDLRDYAPGFYDVLIYIKKHYNNPPVYVTENGIMTSHLGLFDDHRVAYMRDHLTALFAAKLDGADVRGYFFWNLMDDFEWNTGYANATGLYEVDFSDPYRRRTPRKSAFVYKNIVRSRVIDYNYDPDPYENININNRHEHSSILVFSPELFFTQFFLSSISH